MWGPHAVESVQKLGRTLEASRRHGQSQIWTDRLRANIENRKSGRTEGQGGYCSGPSADGRDLSPARHGRPTEGQLFLLRVLPLTVPFSLMG